MKLSELYGKASGLSETLGVRDVWEKDGAVSVSLPLHGGLLNHAGFVHGGTLSALADVAVGAYNKWNGISAVALHSTVCFLRPASETGELVATVTPQKRGRTVSVYTVTVVQKEVTVAQATVSTFRRDAEK